MRIKVGDKLPSSELFYIDNNKDDERNKYDAKKLGNAFLSSMDVYPSDKLTSMREFFTL